MGRYAEAFRQSLDDPEGFWGRRAPVCLCSSSRCRK